VVKREFKLTIDENPEGTFRWHILGLEGDTTRFGGGGYKTEYGAWLGMMHRFHAEAEGTLK
jgi:hypothetical protein